MDSSTWLNLPQTWGALWPIISNPIIAAAVISIAVEQTAWFQRVDVPNIRKLGVVFLFSVLWSAFIVFADPTFVLTIGNLKQSIFTVIMGGMGITFASQVGYQLVQAIPWLRDILTTLFGAKPTATITSYTTGTTTMSAPTVTLTATATPDTVVAVDEVKTDGQG